MKAEEKQKIVVAVKEKAEQQHLEFFHDSYRKPYATVPVNDHRETYRIKSRDFKLWVTQTLYDLLNFAPPKSLVTACLEEFETTAICRGPQIDVHVRIAESGGGVYIDLTNDRWQAIEVSPSGWRVVDEPPVKFRRAVGMTALPRPAAGGNLRELTNFLNTFRARAGSAFFILAVTRHIPKTRFFCPFFVTMPALCRNLRRVGK